MAAVLEVVPATVMDRWSLAGWLAAPNRQLAGDVPFDALHDGRERLVVELAGRLAARANA